jgi:23S rRNA U2552 (ribose-2'-O)-methylase RlmE/FtsJ
MLRLLLLPPLRLPPSLHSALLLQRHASSKSSQAYIARQKTDHFVAARGSFRSRAAFKLVALAKKYKLLKDSVVTVVDLGSSPGGWSQVLTQGKSGKRTVVAVDLLEMEKIDGVHFVKGDFLDPRTRLRIRDYLIEEGGRNGHNKADLLTVSPPSSLYSLRGWEWTLIEKRGGWFAVAANVSGSPVKDGQAALDIVESCYECVPVLSQGF